MTVDDIARYRILDCMISAAGFDRIRQALLKRRNEGSGGYVCFSNVHTVVTARNDDRLRDITNASFISAADGRPLSFIGRMMKTDQAMHVPGPDFMMHMVSSCEGVRHYFYGSTPETLAALQRTVKEYYPGAIIAGAWSPPFREFSGGEEEEILEKINSTRPDFIWVGLGAPKQEYWMEANYRRLCPAVLLGVGAAFDFFAGSRKRAPRWMQKAGLEWLFRLSIEPGRLWKRYTVTNALFIYYIFADLFKRFFGNKF